MKKLDVLFTGIMILMLSGFGVLLLCSNNKEYSELEGRSLSIKPSFFISSNQKMKALETYYQDHFLFRNLFLEKSVSYKQKIGISSNGGVYIGKDGYLLEAPQKVLLASDFITTMNQFYQTHNDIHMSLILIPTHVTMNPAIKPDYAPIYDEHHQIKSIYHQITFDTIDVVESLQQGNQDYEMYYHLDSNLTSYGGYYIYKEYGRLNDISISMIDFDIEEVNSTFFGNLGKKAHTFSYPKDKIVKFIPKKGLDIEVTYQNQISNTLYQEEKKEVIEDYFLGSKEPLIMITNKKAENKEILIVKDDSANMIIPFFVNDYSKVHVIDTDDYHQSISEYLEQHKEIKDVVFLYKMNELDHQIKNFSF